MATKKAPEPTPVLRIITLDELVAVQDLGEKTVPMPEWGRNVAVRIRGLSMEDIYAARKATAGITDDVERRAMMNLHFVAAGVIDPPLTPDVVGILRTKSSDAVLRLIDEISGLNGATAEVAASLEAEFPAEQPG